MQPKNFEEPPKGFRRGQNQVGTGFGGAGKRANGETVIHMGDEDRNLDLCGGGQMEASGRVWTHLGSGINRTFWWIGCGASGKGGFVPIVQSGR